MNIPKQIKVGCLTYDVEVVDRELCVDGKEVRGRIEYDHCKILIRSDVQCKQSMILTLFHELIHAMVRERGLEWGNDDELYTEELAKSLFQVTQDNPNIFKD